MAEDASAVRAENRKLARAIRDLDARLAAAKGQVSKLEVENAELKNQLRRHEDERKPLSSRNRLSSADLAQNTLVRTNSLANIERANFQSRIQVLSSQLEEKDKEMKKLRENQREANMEVRHLRRVSSVTELQAENTVRDNASLLAELESTKSMLSDARNENDQIRADLKVATEELDKLETTLREAYDSKIGETTKENDRLREENEVLKTKMKDQYENALGVFREMESQLHDGRESGLSLMDPVVELSRLNLETAKIDAAKSAVDQGEVLTSPRKEISPLRRGSPFQYSALGGPAAAKLDDEDLEIAKDLATRTNFSRASPVAEALSPPVMTESLLHLDHLPKSSVASFTDLSGGIYGLESASRIREQQKRNSLSQSSFRAKSSRRSKSRSPMRKSVSPKKGSPFKSVLRKGTEGELSMSQLFERVRAEQRMLREQRERSEEESARNSIWNSIKDRTEKLQNNLALRSAVISASKGGVGGPSEARSTYSPALKRSREDSPGAFDLESLRAQERKPSPHSARRLSPARRTSPFNQPRARTPPSLSATMQAQRVLTREEKDVPQIASSTKGTPGGAAKHQQEAKELIAGLYERAKADKAFLSAELQNLQEQMRQRHAGTFDVANRDTAVGSGQYAVDSMSGRVLNK